jgi:drug/metabolite transporter (DMT)-like permease
MVSRLSVTIASISVLTAPVVGVLSSALLLGDTFTWQKLVALMAIILSISLVTFQGDEKAKRKD